ncbi:S-layer protein [Deinococcus arenae]|uniref:S-layer protein n=1 Tax=Deinococcus arenae TaxID=1452751 RepID=A0A8H9GSL4_9DEIO|nr:exo-alpha-sialidase [Deinococcus arenae]GGM58211.1 S-layer protein [Deinococcus arenae]
MTAVRPGPARRTRPLWWVGALTGAGLLLAAYVGWPRPAAATLSGDFHALRALPGGTVLYGQHAGVARSTHGGRTWSAPDGAGDAMALAVLPGQDTLILAGHDVLKRSRDGGVTWQNQGFGNLPGTDLHGFAVRPDRPGTWYANVAGRGLYRTADGVTWQAVSPATQDAMTLAAAPGGRLYALSMSQGLVTSPTGVDWARVTRAPAAVAVDVHPVSGAVYLAGPDGVSRSLDGGQRWETLRLPEGARLVTADPQDDRQLLSVGESGRVYRSSDAGRTWSPNRCGGGP